MLVSNSESLFVKLEWYASDCQTVAGRAHDDTLNLNRKLRQWASEGEVRLKRGAEDVRDIKNGLSLRKHKKKDSKFSVSLWIFYHASSEKPPTSIKWLGMKCSGASIAPPAHWHVSKVKACASMTKTGERESLLWQSTSRSDVSFSLTQSVRLEGSAGDLTKKICKI